MLAAGLVGGAVAAVEIRTSVLQAHFFNAMIHDGLLTRTSTEPPPAVGPQDIRRGYDRMQAMRVRLAERGYGLSPPQSWQDRSIFDLRLYPAYDEKPQAGLVVEYPGRRALYNSRFPALVYPDFASIPPLVWRSLAFVEDRQLLDPGHPPTWNPVINWPRLAQALEEHAINALGVDDIGQSGASTLGTQLVKMLHSPQGATANMREKLVQIATASVIAYGSGGPHQAAEQFLLRYLNAMPLSARPGTGEICGMKDGLRQWFGSDPSEADALLARAETGRLTPAELPRAARFYRQVLTLVMAVKKPSDYLRGAQGRKELDDRVSSFLPLLRDAGIVPPDLAGAALGLKADYAREAAAAPGNGGMKWREAERTKLMELLGAESLHALDRYDVRALSTADPEASDAGERLLHALTDPAQAESSGLIGPRLLTPDQAPDMIYMASLYETLPGGRTVLRMQVDNYGGPLNLNEDSKLELGSTAKLRVLVSYLQAVAELYERYAPMPPQDRPDTGSLSPDDALTRWVLDALKESPAPPTRAAMLEAALEKTYSANPGEGFFTGGGVHRFANFDSRFNGQRISVRQALYNSVNLPFVRIFRDVVAYTAYQRNGSDPHILENMANPSRKAYIDAFIDRESVDFLRKFWAVQKDLGPAALAGLLAGRTRKTIDHLAVVFRAVRPEASAEDMAAFIADHCAACGQTPQEVRNEYEQYAPGRFSLNDQGYIAGLHPLELWLAGWLAKGGGDFEDAVKASAGPRRDSYAWLYKPWKKKAQDLRIRTEIEREAFRTLNRDWARSGYSFELVPDLGATLGLADTAATTSAFLQTLQNGGAYVPARRFESISFGDGTPFAFTASPSSARPDQAIAPDVAKLVLDAMKGVVEEGTARSLRGALVLPDGQSLPFGGKTGTGDNKTGETTRNRVAAFIAAIDDRFSMTVIAYVPGDKADRFTFTSALAMKVFRAMAPVVAPVIARAYGAGPERVQSLAGNAAKPG